MKNGKEGGEGQENAKGKKKAHLVEEKDGTVFQRVTRLGFVLVWTIKIKGESNTSGREIIGGDGLK